jgi:hypothetical protein
MSLARCWHAPTAAIRWSAQLSTAAVLDSGTSDTLLQPQQSQQPSATSAQKKQQRQQVEELQQLSEKLLELPQAELLEEFQGPTGHDSITSPVGYSSFTAAMQDAAGDWDLGRDLQDEGTA